MGKLNYHVNSQALGLCQHTDFGASNKITKNNNNKTFASFRFMIIMGFSVQHLFTNSTAVHKDNNEWLTLVMFYQQSMGIMP